MFVYIYIYVQPKYYTTSYYTMFYYITLHYYVILYYCICYILLYVIIICYYLDYIIYAKLINNSSTSGQIERTCKKCKALEQIGK